MIQKMEFIELDLKGAYIIKPFCATDERGSFIKDYNIEMFRHNVTFKNHFYVLFHCLFVLF